MRTGSGIAGASLLYGPHTGRPDLLRAMQHLVEDLSSDGRRISGLRLGGDTLRLRADPWEIVLTLAAGPLPAAALGGLVRPVYPPDQPDFARVHLGRMLRVHAHAMGFLLRHRGAWPAGPEAARSLAREGQLCLLAIFEASPADLLIWQPGSLVLSPQELRAADPGLLLLPGDRSQPLGLTRPERRGLVRPDPVMLAAADPTPDSAPPDEAPVAPRPRSLGRIFGAPPEGPRPSLPGIDRASDRVALALRGRARPPDGDPRPHGQVLLRVSGRVALAALLPMLGWLGG